MIIVFFFLKFFIDQVVILFICRWSFDSSQVQREVVSIMFMYNFYIKVSMVNDISLSINYMVLIVNYRLVEIEIIQVESYSVDI